MIYAILAEGAKRSKVRRTTVLLVTRKSTIKSIDVWGGRGETKTGW